MKLIHNYVGAKAVSGCRTFPNIHPADGTHIADVAEAGRETVDEAVASARRALDGPWRAFGVKQRAALLHRVADGIEQRFAEFVEAEVGDTGKPEGLASQLDVRRAVANFRAFADLAAGAGLEAFETEMPDGSRALNYAVRKPIGVVGIILPWNLPLLLLTWKAAAALACGNTVVAKPSEETPSSAVLLAEVITQAGIPEGVFNVVHGFGPDSAGQFLAEHPGVDALTFTGESQVGATIMKTVAPTLKSISFELGGKNPALVFADCDWQDTLQGITNAVFTNTGQVCLCAERVYIERSIFEPFVKDLKARAEALRLGWPRDPETTTGPLISAKHREKVLSYFQLAKEEGANVITGGGVPCFGDARDSGFYVQPTVLTGLPESARCVREEIFGPVCHCAPFDTEEEAIRMANDTQYGLAATLWTTNLKRAHRVAPQLRVGITWVNSWFLRDLRTPFGGVGLSGIGREGGIHSLNFYSEPNNICIKV